MIMSEEYDYVVELMMIRLWSGLIMTIMTKVFGRIPKIRLSETCLWLLRYESSPPCIRISSLLDLFSSVIFSNNLSFQKYRAKDCGERQEGKIGQLACSLPTMNIWRTRRKQNVKICGCCLKKLFVILWCINVNDTFKKEKCLWV